jgi:hypothetical protein
MSKKTASDQVYQMLHELGTEYTQKAAGEMVVAFGCGIAFLISMIQEEHISQAATDAVCKAIREQVKSYTEERIAETGEEDVEEMSADEFLRDHFNPEKFNG